MDELTLEKLKIDERLKSVEKFMIEGQIIRENIQETLVGLDTNLTKVRETIYGDGKPDGLVQKVEYLIKLEEARGKNIGQVWGVLWALITAVALNALPEMLRFITTFVGG